MREFFSQTLNTYPKNAHNTNSSSKSKFEEQSIGLPLQVTKSIFRIQMMRILILPFLYVPW